MATAQIPLLNGVTPAAPSGYVNARWQQGPSTSTDPTYDVPIVPDSCYVPNVGGVSVKTANYTATIADMGTRLVFDSSSAVTLTLPNPIPNNALTPPSTETRWNVNVTNIGSGTLTISRNGLNIDGAASNISLAQFQSCSISTDGTNFFSGRGLGSATPSGAANLVYATPNGSSGNASLRALVPADLPVGSSSQLGAVQVDNTSIVASAGVISAVGTAVKGVYVGNTASAATPGTPTTLTAAFGSNVTPGNALLVMVYHGAAAAGALSDVQGDTFTSIVASIGGTWDAEFFIALNVKGGATTISCTTTGQCSILAWELQNIVAASAFDAAGDTTLLTPTPPFSITASATTTNASDYLLGIGILSHGSGAGTFSAPFTGRYSGLDTVSSNFETILGDANVTSAGSQSCTLNVTAGGGSGTLLQLIALKVSTGVSDFNGRTGHVTPATNDYSFSEISGTLSNSQLPTSGVTAGSYSSSNITVNAEGIITAASDGSGGAISPAMLKANFRSGGGRALGTIYHNTSTFPLIVMGDEDSTGASCFCDSSSSPTTQVWGMETFSGAANPFCFIVPPSYYYKVTGGSFSAWNEFTFNAGTSSWSGNLSGSRSLGSSYQNTGTGIMFVQVYITGTSAGTVANGLADTSNPPTTQLYEMYPLSSVNSVFIAVLPGEFYKVTSGGSVAGWYELSTSLAATKSLNLFNTNSGSPTSRQIGNNSNTSVGISLGILNGSQSKVRFAMVQITSGNTGTFSFRSDDSVLPQTQIVAISAQNGHQKTAWGFCMPMEFMYIAQDSDQNPGTKTGWYEWLIG